MTNWNLYLYCIILYMFCAMCFIDEQEENFYNLSKIKERGKSNDHTEAL